MSSDDRDRVPCYIGVCPVCSGVVMICVADPFDMAVMRDAMKSRRECERAGLLTETLTLAEGKARMKVQFGHVDDCAKDPRRKKKAKARRQGSLLPALQSASGSPEDAT